jgi:hypothetical protein
MNRVVYRIRKRLTNGFLAGETVEETMSFVDDSFAVAWFAVVSENIKAGRLDYAIEAFEKADAIASVAR